MTMPSEPSPPPLARIPHTERCLIDRLIVGSCFHDSETGERVDPPDKIPVFQV